MIDRKPAPLAEERTPGAEERRKALGRERSRKFYNRNQEALQRKAYFRCLEKGLIRTVRPSTALKYGIPQGLSPFSI